MFRAEAGFSEMHQAIVAHMLSSQHVRAAALFEAIVEDEGLGLGVFGSEESTELVGEGEELFGYLEDYSKWRWLYLR